MSSSHDDLSPLVSTACADLHGLGVPSEDLTQEGYLYAIEARAAYDPVRHKCPESAYVVTTVRRRLTRFCARSRARGGVPLPASVESRELSPPLAAELNERIAAERRKMDARHDAV